LFLAALAGLLMAHGRGPCGEGSPEGSEACGAVVALPEEDEEALAATTMLLQSTLEQRRGPARLVGMRTAMLHQLSASASRRDGTLQPTVSSVLASAGKPDSDPYWAETYATIRRLLETSAAARNFLRLCKANDLVEYTATGCAPDAEGSTVVNGTVADAYYCGAPSVNFSKLSYPVTRICTAQPGSAYTLEGYCGKYSQKELVLNFVKTVPNWSKNVQLINVPSIDCILGLGDCDIYYCQHCPGRCA